ncbi:MAG: collagen binding domain-containing protein [Terracidiphilus sp.]
MAVGLAPGLLYATPQAASLDPQAQSAAVSVTIRGRVVSTVDGKPIPGATVALPSANRSVLTDDNGRFEFDGVTGPGTVFVLARKTGFLQQPEQNGQSGSKQAEILTQDVELNLALMPEAVIAGLVKNDSDLPVRGMNLNLMERHVKDGFYVWDKTRAATTDDDGTYTIANLEPGTYVVRTTIMADPDEIRRNDSTTGHGYAVEYFPNAENIEGAKSITVAAGEHATANLTVPKQAFQLITIPYQPALVEGAGSAVPRLTEADGENSIDSTWDQDAHLFHMLGPRGSYTFTFTFGPGMTINGLVPWKDGTTNPYYGIADFNVDNGPVTVPEAAVQHPVSIPIHVKTDFTEQERYTKASIEKYGSYRPPEVRFILIEQQSEQYSVNWTLRDPEENVAFKNVIPGRYTVRGWPADGLYLSSLRCNSVDLMHEPLTVTPGSPTCSIEVVVRDDIASVEVGLTPEGLAAMTSAGLSAASPRLIPLDNPAKPAPWTDIFFRDSNSARFANVSPGTYLAIISDEGIPQLSDPRIAYRDPAILKKLRACGQEIDVKPHEQVKVLVNWCSNR